MMLDHVPTRSFQVYGFCNFLGLTKKERVGRTYPHLDMGVQVIAHHRLP